MSRTILHCDINNCFASVEVALNPELKGRALVVGGSERERHGIVLAKSEEAKRYGIKTAETLYEARKKCPHLLVVPPHYDEYLKVSKAAQAIYYRYTDQVEPYGLDECWLDVTGSLHLFGSGKEIADEIRETFINELDLTISAGVSFNKIFAKLGSDLKKPNATTCIPEEHFKELIWGLPASELLGVGRATTAKLASRAIFTIGDLAAAHPGMIKRLLGKPGLDLWHYANGRDYSRVKPVLLQVPIKTVGNGTTCVENLVGGEEVWRVMYALAQNVSRRLRSYQLEARGVQIGIRNSDLGSQQWQAPLALPTQNAKEIAQAAHQLFSSVYGWEKEVRAVTVRAINLQSAALPLQLSLFNDFFEHERLDVIERTMLLVNEKFGARSIVPASLLSKNKIPSRGLDHVGMPNAMYR